MNNRPRVYGRAILPGNKGCQTHAGSSSESRPAAVHRNLCFLFLTIILMLWPPNREISRLISQLSFNYYLDCTYNVISIQHCVTAWHHLPLTGLFLLPTKLLCKRGARNVQFDKQQLSFPMLHMLTHPIRCWWNLNNNKTKKMEKYRGQSTPVS